MRPDVMTGNERKKYRDISHVLVCAWAENRISKDEYDLILRAIIRRRKDLISNKSSRFPSTAVGEDAEQMRAILIKFEGMGKTPSGFYDEDVALEY